jgi:rare lipoprotein A
MPIHAGEMRRQILAPIVLAAALAAGCASSSGRLGLDASPPEFGYASYYSARHGGRATASGEIYDPDYLTAAHRTLPFGTRVRVTNLDNGRQVVVTITDRGPFRRGRVIDVSERAARKLGFTAQGVTRVRVDVLPG